MSAQTHLPLKLPRYDLPVMEVGTAIGVLFSTCPGITADQVRELVERGAIWAWNVASPGSKLADLRLLTPSVTAIENARELLDDDFAISDPFPAAAPSAIAMVMAWLDKHTTCLGKPWFTGKQLANAFGFRRTHMLDLVRENVFLQIPGTQFRKGPGGYPLIPRTAVEKFLTERLAC